MTLMEFILDPNRKTLYLDWVKSEATQVMLKLVRDNFGPAGLNSAEPLYYAGQVDRYTQMMYALEHLDNLGEAARFAKQIEGLEADYGKDEILKKERNGK